MSLYAVIESGGKQHRVCEGELLKLEKLALDPGATVHFDKVLMIAGGDAELALGDPYLPQAKVQAEVIEHGRHAKVNILKFRRRKHHLKRQGHRQHYTQVKITGINAG